MSNKISVTGRVLRRWKEERGGRTDYHIALTDDAPKFPNILKMTSNEPSKFEAAKVDARVTVEAYVGGRLWTRPADNKEFYFTDIRVSSCVPAAAPVKDEPPPPEAEADPDEFPF